MQQQQRRTFEYAPDAPLAGVKLLDDLLVEVCG
jgi:hypothetical protein